jgi:hypothetical protein
MQTPSDRPITNGDADEENYLDKGTQKKAEQEGQ